MNRPASGCGLYRLVFFLPAIFLFPTILFAAEDTAPRPPLTEGEFAVQLARTMNLQRSLPPAPLAEDCIELLEQLGIAPPAGWDAARRLSRQNYTVIMGIATGKETQVSADLQKACDMNARMIDVLYWQQQHISLATVDNLGQMLENRALFPTGPPVCPYGVPYEDKDGDGRIDLHRHSGRSVLLEQAAAGGAGETAPVEDTSVLLLPFADLPFIGILDPNKVELLKLLRRMVDCSVKVTHEYDNNVFSEETNEDWDHLTVIAPNAGYRRQGDRIFGALNYSAEATHYYHHSAWAILQRYAGQLTATPNPRWALGFRNTWSHSGQSQVPDGVGGDRAIATGYDINSGLVQNKLRLGDRLILAADYQHDYIDFDNAGQDTYVDRIAQTGKLSFEYWLTPRFAVSAGGAYRDLDFDATAADSKDFNTTMATLGLTWKVPGWFTVDLAVEEEWRDFATGSNDENLNLRAGLTTTFSRFTSGGVKFVRGLGDSSRQDYRQYTSDRITANLRHYFTPRTSVYLGGNWEHQLYREADRSVLSTTAGDRDSIIYSCDLILQQTITTWLSATGSYTFARKNTDFTGAGYRAHRGGAGLSIYW